MAFKLSDIWKGKSERSLSKNPDNTFAPLRRKMKGGLQSNGKLLRGIYDGSNQDFALSSYILTDLINIPKNLVGVPGITSDDDTTLVKKLLPLLIDEFPILVRVMLVIGTAWRWARWSDKLMRLAWEAIPDDSIKQIIVDLDTQEIAEMYTDEMLEHGEGEQNIQNTRRRRHITREKITEIWSGGINKKVEYRNPFGFMPVPFGHDCWEGEWRGESVISRVLRLLKSTHDIIYSRDEILSSFKPKLVQTIEGSDDDVATWRKHNGLLDRDALFDPWGMDFVLNQGLDRTEFLSLPSDATAQHTAAVKDNEGKIMIGSSLPQLFFGVLTTGTQAANNVQGRVAVEFIKSIQDETIKPLIELVNQSLTILAFMNFTQAPQVKIAYGAFDLMDAEQKSRIFSSYASGISTMLSSGTLTAEGALYFSKMLFADFPEQSKEDFVEGMKHMIVEVGSHVGQQILEAGDLAL
jgi:hypothetical protein